jgi:hypothetical protein
LREQNILTLSPPRRHGKHERVNRACRTSMSPGRPYMLNERVA